MPRANATTPAAFDRTESLKRLASEELDVLVIGGGITGTGVALDAASRGLRTGLVERGDFASGTSSKSSKMVHGGLRYLQQHDFRLVYEALHERQRLLDNAPHLVSPLAFLIPLFGRDGVVSRQVARTYSTALWLYDVTGGLRIGRRHRRIGREEALSLVPTLRTDRLVAAFEYWDARADDARLTLAVARTAADHGALVANYAPVTGLLNAAGRIAGAVVEPLFGSQAFEVKAKVVVNATGVWADDIRALDEKGHPHSIRPAKGIHLTVPSEKLPAKCAAVIPVPHDRRSIFVVPWSDGADVYLGTTDTDWDGSLDDPACEPEDVDYILAAINTVTSSSLDRSDVTGVWAGLRPLLRPAAGHHVSDRTADLSRRHSVKVSASGLVTVTGGKLTTYRKMAQDTVDQVVSILGARAPEGSKRCPTSNLALHGAPSPRGPDLAEIASGLGLSTELAEAVVGRHGTDAPSVIALASGRPELLEPLVPGLPALAVEALWAVRHEMAMTLDDVLARRTRSVLRKAAASAAEASRIATLLSQDLGRTSEEAAREARELVANIRQEMARAGLANQHDSEHEKEHA